MKRRRKTRIRINLKRFIISLSFLGIIFLLTANISKKIFAKNHNDKNTELNKEIEIYEYIDKEEDVPVEDTKKEEVDDIENKDDTVDVPLDKGVIRDEKKVDKLEENIPQPKKEDNPSKSNDYREVFKDDLFLGDSITDSISFYEFLDESHVVAKLGLTAKEAINQMDDIVKSKPKDIYMMFGMNDILTGEGSQKFVENYRELVRAIKDELPDSNLYIQSILYVAPKVKNKKPLLTNENVDDFNQALMDMAEDEGIEYLNIGSILEDNMDLLEPDGIHVKYKFYKLWLNYLTENTK